MKNISRRTVLGYAFQGTAGAALLNQFGLRSLYASEGVSFSDVAPVDLTPKTALQLTEDWEGLNPGYWTFEKGQMRRAITAVGDRARNTGFPFHYESQTNIDGVMPTVYDPSLPMSTFWNRKWKLGQEFSIAMRFKVNALTVLQREDDDPNWQMYQSSYGLFGLSLGGNSQFESFYPSKDASPTFLIKESGEFGFMRYTSGEPEFVDNSLSGKVRPLKVDDEIDLVLTAKGSVVYAKVQVNSGSKLSDSHEVQWTTDQQNLSGYFGVVARGLLDVSVVDIAIDAIEQKPLNAPINDCHVCYPLGDTLKETDTGWQVRFVGLFRSGDSDGENSSAEIRVSDQEQPAAGWKAAPSSGSAKIISNEFRDNTAIIDVVLPFNPAEKTQYFTVWKDGVDVTPDPRIGTDSVGPGTGLVGDVPTSGGYVGRLPQLQAPYRLCGLSCHAIHSAQKAELPDAEGGRCTVSDLDRGKLESECGIPLPFYVHDQPCYSAFKHLEQHNFQIMLWEDDVWYLELLLYPPSTKDAYKQITTTIAGPTTRWQMMRHWNVLNPGDHDHGMDDVKGPEQILIRNRDDLGQDPSYMVRNFQIVSHLMTGKENPTGRDNPKRWRKWKMPNRDFSLLVMDSRLWRSSQDPAIWDDEGWGHDKQLYSRTDPTRVMLGEEQYSWLQDELTTDSSSLICLTGINALHTIWGGHDGKDWINSVIDRDRVSADYAGWVKVAADRVLDLISNRDGVVTVYGDVHAGSIVRNKDNRIIECSFGPIGRWGGRSLVGGFGQQMKDFDGRELECVALYHHVYKNAKLEKQETINYWNYLDMEFDTSRAESEVRIGIRNITDPAGEGMRGGGEIDVKASDIGKPPTAKIQAASTLGNADLLFLSERGLPLRGARSLADGQVPINALYGVQPGERVTIVAIKAGESASQTLMAEKLES